jgi:hypothetical protein
MIASQDAPPASAPQPPPLPLPPATGVGGTPATAANPNYVRLEDLLGRPVTAADVRDIRARATTLSNQLLSAQGRRDEVAKELSRTSDPAVRAGLEQRLKVLDDRLATLEMDIAANSRLRAAIAPSSQSSTSEAPRSMSPIPGLTQGSFTALIFVLVIFVLAPLAGGLARRLWQRPVPVAPNPQLAAQAERMERMEHAIDAVAIEVERISEGQRFVTQLLAKREAAVLGVGQAGER